MEQRKIYLEENKSMMSVNEQPFINVALSTKSKLLPYNNISDVLNLNELYTEERDNCNKFRIIMTVNPICTNILFNAKTEVVRYEGSSAATLLSDEYEPGPTPPPPGPSGETYSLSVEPTKLKYEYSGGSETITITAENQGWTIIEHPEWISFDTSSGGEGETTVTVTAAFNDEYGNRSGIIRIKGQESGEVQQVDVEQTKISFALVTRYVDGKPSTYNNLPRYARVYFQTYEGASPETGTLISEEDVTTSCTWRWAWDAFSTYACKDEPQHTDVERVKYNTTTHQEETGEWDTVKFISLGVPQQTMLCTSEPWEFKYTRDSKEYTFYFWPTWSWV